MKLKLEARLLQEISITIWHPTPVLLPGNSHGWRSLAGYSPWDHEESEMTKWLSTKHRGKANLKQEDYVKDCNCTFRFLAPYLALLPKYHLASYHPVPQHPPPTQPRRSWKSEASSQRALKGSRENTWIFIFRGDNKKIALLLGHSTIVHKPHLCFPDFQLAFLYLTNKYDPSQALAIREPWTSRCSSWF